MGNAPLTGTVTGFGLLPSTDLGSCLGKDIGSLLTEKEKDPGLCEDETWLQALPRADSRAGPEGPFPREGLHEGHLLPIPFHTINSQL